ncbi:lipase family protein [Zhihengliuella halotolerans]|uniref:Secretory lipase n=1 Tax=Zhihengliuella halotolerans TaxID=370736 RepID=A0A4Q8AGR4_9MICC|nr:lipase family protein [Zhihengliuella halotolerans]RZU63484.1 secretory lipase [Zhihengliuella halotolerans]
MTRREDQTGGHSAEVRGRSDARHRRSISITLTALIAAASLVAAGSPAQATADPAPAQEELTDAGAATDGDLLREEALEELSRSVDGDFYLPPSTLPDGQGTLIRSESAEFYLDPVRLIEPDATATRIMYTSTDAHGAPMAVTGTVLVPNRAWSGRGERPLIGYAVGTQGAGDHCAPSRQMAIGQEYEGPMVAALLEAGYALALTDYQGLGTPGAHSYMVRAAQGHAVLDSLRAAQNLGLDGIDAENPAALVGYSQGGGASAAAAELAPDYAPELQLKGAYAGAVPGDLQQVATKIDSTLYTGFLLFAMSSLDSQYPIDLTSVLNAAGRDRVAAAADQCVVDGLAGHAFVNTSTLTTTGESFTDLSRRAPFAGVLQEQRIGAGRAPEVPVLLSHSLLDDVIPYRAGRGVAERWCDQGAVVSWETTAAPTHLGGYAAAVPRALLFLEARFAGAPALSSCWRI